MKRTLIILRHCSAWKTLCSFHSCGFYFDMHHPPKHSYPSWHFTMAVAHDKELKASIWQILQTQMWLCCGKLHKKSNPWRCWCGLYLAKTHWGMDTWPLGVVCGVQGTRALGGDPLNPELFVMFPGPFLISFYAVARQFFQPVWNLVCNSVWCIHMNARTQGLPAEHCSVKRWSMLFSSSVDPFSQSFDMRPSLAGINKEVEVELSIKCSGTK